MSAKPTQSSLKVTDAMPPLPATFTHSGFSGYSFPVASLFMIFLALFLIFFANARTSNERIIFVSLCSIGILWLGVFLVLHLREFTFVVDDDSIASFNILGGLTSRLRWQDIAQMRNREIRGTFSQDGTVLTLKGKNQRGKTSNIKVTYKLTNAPVLMIFIKEKVRQYSIKTIDDIVDAGLTRKRGDTDSESK